MPGTAVATPPVATEPVQHLDVTLHIVQPPQSITSQIIGIIPSILKLIIP